MRFCCLTSVESSPRTSTGQRQKKTGMPPSTLGSRPSPAVASTPMITPVALQGNGGVSKTSNKRGSRKQYQRSGSCKRKSDVSVASAPAGSGTGASRLKRLQSVFTNRPHVRIARQMSEAISDCDTDKVCKILDDSTTNIGDFEDSLDVLHSACATGYASTVAVLLRHGACVNSFGRTDRAPLHVAVRYGSLAVTSLLLSHGASVNAATKFEGRCPLHLAASSGNVDMIRLLVENKARINQGDIYGSTPLQLATRAGKVESVKVLLSLRALVDAYDRDGWTALHLACAAGFTDIAQVLLQSHANVNCQNKYGRTPLHWACAAGYIATAELLLRYQADVMIVDLQGKSALDHVLAGAVPGPGAILSSSQDRRDRLHQLIVDALPRSTNVMPSPGVTTIGQLVNIDGRTTRELCTSAYVLRENIDPKQNWFFERHEQQNQREQVAVAASDPEDGDVITPLASSRDGGHIESQISGYRDRVAAAGEGSERQHFVLGRPPCSKRLVLDETTSLKSVVTRTPSSEKSVHFAEDTLSSPNVLHTLSSACGSCSMPNSGRSLPDCNVKSTAVDDKSSASCPTSRMRQVVDQAMSCNPAPIEDLFSYNRLAGNNNVGNKSSWNSIFRATGQNASAIESMAVKRGEEEESALGDNLSGVIPLDSQIVPSVKFATEQRKVMLTKIVTRFTDGCAHIDRTLSNILRESTHALQATTVTIDSAGSADVKVTSRDNVTLPSTSHDVTASSMTPTSLAVSAEASAKVERVYVTLSSLELLQGASRDRKVRESRDMLALSRDNVNLARGLDMIHRDVSALKSFVFHFRSDIKTQLDAINDPPALNSFVD